MQHLKELQRLMDEAMSETPAAEDWKRVRAVQRREQTHDIRDVFYGIYELYLHHKVDKELQGVPGTPALERLNAFLAAYRP